MSSKARLIEYLNALKDADYNSEANAVESNMNAEKAFRMIFLLGFPKTEFTFEEEIILGDLLATVIVPLQINIVYTVTASSLGSKLRKNVFMKRSALQFLLNDFGQFPVGDSTLGEVLKDAGIEESIKTLDDHIEYLSNMKDCEEYSNDEESADLE